MTRTILKNAAGEEKSVDELRQLIRATCGIEPAKSLDQMLYKRASAGRGFYKTTEGKFGLTELRRGLSLRRSTAWLCFLKAAFQPWFGIQNWDARWGELPGSPHRVS